MNSKRNEIKMKSVKAYNFNVYYRENTSDEDVLDHSFENDIFLKGMPEYKVSDGDTIIDVGAHIGTLSLLCSLNNKTGKIYSIEPCQQTYNVLVKNIRENNVENIYPTKVALSDKKGDAKLFYDIETGNWGHSITKQFSEQGEIVETNSLDDYFLENKIEKCNFLKFNCEGSEFKILLNTSSDTFNKIEKMLVLYHMDLSDRFHVDQIINKLHSNGFYVEKRFVTHREKRGWLIVVKTGFFGKLLLLSKYYSRKLFSLFKRAVNKIIAR